MTCAGAAPDGGELGRRRSQTAAKRDQMTAKIGGEVNRLASASALEGKARVGKKIGEYELVEYDELPEYMKENEYIRRYYRAEWPLKHALFSLFRWHNETLNVWTHLVGFFVFLGLTLMHLRDVPVIADILHNFNLNWPMAVGAAENASKDPRNLHGTQVEAMIRLSASSASGRGSSSSDIGVGDGDHIIAPRWPLMVFMCGSMFCLLCSSQCHLFCCHSRRVNLFLWRMDYVGIAVMIVTSFFPPIYYVFLCQPHWQVIYLSAISTMGIATAITLFSPQFSTAPFRIYRFLLFLAMGFSGVVPAVHAAIVNWDEPQRPITLAYELAMALLYVTGTAFYVSRVPERWKPGLFDLTGHSHQIFHALVVCGALAHYAATLLLLEWRDRPANACGPQINAYQ